MTQEQEIRAKALEISVLMLGARMEIHEHHINRCYQRASVIAEYIREGTLPQMKEEEPDL